jgi:type II secretory pathway component PulJ
MIKLTSNHSKGFSLLELIIALGAITTMAIFAIQMLSNQLGLRQKVEFVSEAQRQVSNALTRMTKDLRNTFIQTTKYQNGFHTDQFTPPLFKGNETSLFFMSRSYRSFRYHENAGKLNNVLYEKKANPLQESQLQFIRYIDLDLTERIQNANRLIEQVLIENLKEAEITFWNGSQFIEEWDSEQQDQKGLLPKMVKIRLSSWISLTSEQEMLQMRRRDSEQDARSFFEAETIVYLPSTKGKDQVATIAQDYSWQL